jgi:FAD/FMN-containing dehydrogenase
MSLFAEARAATADQLTAFELIPRAALELALADVPGTIDPIEAPYPWYVLLEMSSSESESGIRGLLERLVGTALEEGFVGDGVIAESGAQAKALWRIREAIAEAQNYSGSVSRVAEFINRATLLVSERLPGIRPVAFGHIGDGNIHFNLTQPEVRTGMPIWRAGRSSTTSSTVSCASSRARSAPNTVSAGSSATRSPTTNRRSRSS